MKKIFYYSLLILFIIVGLNKLSFSQCAMCKAGAESSLKDGNKTASGLNSGIMYLLIMPYVLVGGLGYYWYVKNKKQNAGDDITEPN